MKESALLRVTTLLSVFFVVVHITGDIVFGFDKGGTPLLIALPVFAIWAYAALVLTERKWGYIVIIIGSLLGLVVPAVHMTGSGLGKGMDNTGGAFVFVWTTITLGITSIISVILSVRGLWRRPTSI